MRWHYLTVAALLVGACESPPQRHEAVSLRDSGPARPARPRTVENRLGMRMVLVPGGTSLMGSTLGPDEVVRRFGGSADHCRDEHPRHAVTIEQPFYLAVQEVSVGQFRAFVEATGYRTGAERQGWAFAYQDGQARRVEGLSWRSPGFAQTEEHPVTCVNWHDATRFCRWLRTVEARPYRLPTEAEWEYACRAGTTAVYWWGDEPDTTGRVANVADAAHVKPGSSYAVMPMDDGHLHTAPCGRYQPNAWGLHDMIGNVCEWCDDAYGPYPDAGAHAEAPSLRANAGRVLRGGSWYNVSYYCRVAYRFSLPPGDAYTNAGFRVAMSAP